MISTFRSAHVEHRACGSLGSGYPSPSSPRRDAISRIQAHRGGSPNSPTPLRRQPSLTRAPSVVAAAVRSPTKSSPFSSADSFRRSSSDEAAAAAEPLQRPVSPPPFAVGLSIAQVPGAIAAAATSLMSSWGAGDGGGSPRHSSVVEPSAGAQRAVQLVHCLREGAPQDEAQSALVAIHAAVTEAGSDADAMSAQDLIRAHVLTAVIRMIQVPSETTALALGTLCSLLALPGVVPPRLLREAEAAAVPSVLRVLECEPPPPGVDDPFHLPCLFLASSSVVRLAQKPSTCARLLSQGVVPLLVAVLRRGAGSPSLLQAAMFALCTLCRGDAPVGGGASPLAQLVEAGGVPALCALMTRQTCGSERSAAMFASGLLLDVSSEPGMPLRVASRGEVCHVVEVVSCPDVKAAMRMSAVLSLARMASTCTACQLDAVREGAVDPLLHLLAHGDVKEQAHAARLLAILAQAQPTHGHMAGGGVVPAAVHLLVTLSRQQSRTDSCGAPNNSPGSGGSLGSSRPTGDTHPEKGPLLGSLTGRDGGGTEVTQQQQQPVLVEHVCCLLAVLAQNPDMHFDMVGQGVVPVLVPLLSSAGAERTQFYALATLLSFALHEGRHAAVIARAGAVVPAVALLRASSTAVVPPPPQDTTSQHDLAGQISQRDAQEELRLGAPQHPTLFDIAAAFVAVIAPFPDIQVELVSAGGIAALTQALTSTAGSGASGGGTSGSTGSGSSSDGRVVVSDDARSHAAEALLLMATMDPHRKRMIARSGVLPSVMSMLQRPSGACQYWAAALLKTLATDELAGREVAAAGGCAAVSDLLRRAKTAGRGQSGDELCQAQVQGAWLVAHLAQEYASELAALGVVRPLVAMLSPAFGTATHSLEAGGEQHADTPDGPHLVDVRTTSASSAARDRSTMSDGFMEASQEASQMQRDSVVGVPAEEEAGEASPGGGLAEGLSALGSSARCPEPHSSYYSLQWSEEGARLSGGEAGRAIAVEGGNDDGSSDARYDGVAAGGTSSRSSGALGGMARLQRGEAGGGGGGARSATTRTRTDLGPLEGNSRAAATAALLALARHSAEVRLQVQMECNFQTWWRGTSIELEGLQAPE